MTRLDRWPDHAVTEMDLRDLRDGRASARQLGRWPTFLMRDIEEVEAKAAELRGDQRRAKLTTMAAKGWSAKLARPIASIACGSQAAATTPLFVAGFELPDRFGHTFRYRLNLSDSTVLDAELFRNSKQPRRSG